MQAATEAVLAEIVQGRCRAGAASATFQVDNVTMKGDPVPLVVKRLRVVYTVNGGAPKSSEAIEGSAMHLGNDGIVIEEAWYGVPGHEVNVTGKCSLSCLMSWNRLSFGALHALRLADIVEGRCPSGAVSMAFHVDNSTMGGDPAPGVVKRLRVTFYVNLGRSTAREAREGSEFRI